MSRLRILSLSGWRGEKSVVRWRTFMGHHMVQEKGRSEILLDYHLRVGQVTRDTQVPAGHAIVEQRLDETETGKATTVTFIDVRRPGGLSEQAPAAEAAACLGLDKSATGLVEWDIYDAVLTPGDLILMLAWRTKQGRRFLRQGRQAAGRRTAPAGPGSARLRHVRPSRGAPILSRCRTASGAPYDRDRDPRALLCRKVRRSFLKRSGGASWQ